MGILSIAAAAILSGVRGYKAISHWADNLGQKTRGRFRCRRVDGRYIVPSQYVIRDVLIRVDPAEVDRALQRWNTAGACPGEGRGPAGQQLGHRRQQDAQRDR